MRYRYVGADPCETPAATWQPGQTQDVTGAIHNVLFEPADAEAQAARQGWDGDGRGFIPADAPRHITLAELAAVAPAPAPAPVKVAPAPAPAPPAPKTDAPAQS